MTLALLLLGDRGWQEIFAKDGPVGILVANLVVAADELELARKLLHETREGERLTFRD